MLGVLTGVVTTAGVVGWTTGAIHQAIQTVTRWWHKLMDWIHQPWDMAHLVAGVGTIAVPAIILIIIMTIVDG